MEEEYKEEEDDERKPCDNGAPVWCYSRQIAIGAGELVDVSEMAREAGIRCPMAVSRRVWSEVIAPGQEANQEGETEKVRLWNMLRVLCITIPKWPTTNNVIHFELFVRSGRPACEVELIAAGGLGDHGEAVGTILMPDEEY